MLEINVYSSGSHGNCYSLSDGKTNILLECGISFNKIQKKTGFQTSKFDACLITHSHVDHAKAVNEVAGACIDVYMSSDTFNELKIKSNVLHRVHEIEQEQQFYIGTFTILPLKMHHDVTCLGFLIYSNVTHERLFFATDTSHISYKLNELDYIMIEANYDLKILNECIMNGSVPRETKRRLIESHQSIDTCIDFLEKTNLSKVKKIYLMHLSSRNSNAEDFKTRVIERTGKQVVVC